MDIDRKFEEWLNSLEEERRKKVLQRLEKLSEEEREYVKIAAAVVLAFEEFEREVAKSVRENLNKEEFEKVDKFELVLLLYRVINQCCCHNGECTSNAFSAYADAMRMLAKLGLLEIEREFGRMVIGRLKGLLGEGW